MEWQLRPATESDRDFLYDLHCRTMREVIERTWGWNETWQRSDFDRRIGIYTTSVLDAGGEPIGGLMLHSTADSVDIVELQILPEHQGKGIGTWVVKKVIENAKRQGVSVTLSVVPANSRAQRLYERIGFRVVRIDEPFIRMRYSPPARISVSVPLRK